MADINGDAVPAFNWPDEDSDDKTYDELPENYSWVQKTYQCEENVNDFEYTVDESLSSSKNNNDLKGLNKCNLNMLDFALHTIVEESFEDSEMENCKIHLNYLSLKPSQCNVSPSVIERYFVFENPDRNFNCCEDSSSEIFSDLSDSVESTKINECDDDQNQFNLSKSRLEKYFLSEFMGFSSENNSDNIVESDSEIQRSASPRSKKLKTRRTSKSNVYSFHNLLKAVDPIKKTNDILSSESNAQQGGNLAKKQLPTRKTPLSLTYNYSNNISQKRTDLMLPKMRQILEILLPVEGSITPSINKTEQQIIPSKTNATECQCFISELIHLWKTVPDISNVQLHEILEYFNSEVTWFNWNEVFNFFDINLKNKNNRNDRFKRKRSCEKYVLFQRLNQDNVMCLLNKETALKYNNFIETFIMKNFIISPKVLSDNNVKYKYQIHKEVKTETIINIWHHIRQKLAYLMREHNIRSYSTPSNTYSATKICIANKYKTQKNKENNSLTLGSYRQPSFLHRSKFHDLLLRTNNLPCHSLSNDYDNFSWRGIDFESELLASGGSRNILIFSGPENRSNVTRWPNKTQSCGNLLEIDRKCFEIQKMCTNRTTYVNKYVEKPLRKMVNNDLLTNSLPALQPFRYPKNMSENSKFNFIVDEPNVKSARYRSPFVQSNNNSLSSVSKQNDKIRKEANVSAHKIVKSSTPFDFSVLGLTYNSNDTNSDYQTTTFVERQISRFRRRSESLSSVCSDYRYETMKLKGQVQFGLQYNYKINALEIHIVQCKDLASVDSKKRTNDPYVKVYLLPDLSKCGKRKTKVKKQTVNPVFIETLRFYLPITKLNKRSIWLTVWNSDFLGRNDFLGEVIINLEGKVFDQPQSQWYTLQQKSI